MITQEFYNEGLARLVESTDKQALDFGFADECFVGIFLGTGLGWFTDLLKYRSLKHGDYPERIEGILMGDLDVLENHFENAYIFFRDNAPAVVSTLKVAIHIWPWLDHGSAWEFIQDNPLPY